MPEKSTPPLCYTTTDRGARLAYRKRHAEDASTRTGMMFLGGFRSDMEGSKALFLNDYATKHNQPYLRFDYSGHGASEGLFTDGCLSMWLEDALYMLDHHTSGKQLIIGSSMGGWIMLHLALLRPERIAGLIGIASAPDFTEKLMWEQFSDVQKQQLHDDGIIYLASEYGEDTPITHNLIQDGKNLCMLDEPIHIHAPLHLLHGMNDVDVPYNVSQRISKQCLSQNIVTSLIKDGDHRLSRPQDLDLLANAVTLLTQKA